MFSRHDAIAEPEDRAAAILTAVKGAFAEKGIAGASMQDLARAAGMSAGNFYRYFPSKAAIVEAIVRGELAQAEAEFAAIIEGGDLLAGLRRVLEARIDSGTCTQCALWDDIEAMAVRSAEIAPIVARIEDGIVDLLLDIFARVSGLTRAEATRRFTAHAMLIVLLFKNVAGRCSADARLGRLHPDMRADLRALLLRRVEDTFAEVLAARSAGRAQ